MITDVRPVCLCVTCLHAGHVWTWVCHQSPCPHKDARLQRSPAAPPCSEAPGSGSGLGGGLSCLEVWRSDCPSPWWAPGTTPSPRAPRPWAVRNPMCEHFVSKHTDSLWKWECVVAFKTTVSLLLMLNIMRIYFDIQIKFNMCILTCGRIFIPLTYLFTATGRIKEIWQ